MEDVLVEFKNVTKRFDTRTILDNVNLKIYENAYYSSTLSGCSHQRKGQSFSVASP